ncbi:MAG: hypothetical protein Q7S89_03185, partial [bacterium]|nr:hypothetical protein [bacterium]
ETMKVRLLLTVKLCPPGMGGIMLEYQRFPEFEVESLDLLSAAIASLRDVHSANNVDEARSMFLRMRKSDTSAERTLFALCVMLLGEDWAHYVTRITVHQILPISD